MCIRDRYKRARYLGRVFQDPMKGTAADLSIEENLALAYRRGKTRSLRWGIHRSERENYKERLKLLDLGLETVSYTHLDVYKRQAQELAKIKYTVNVTSSVDRVQQEASPAF